MGLSIKVEVGASDVCVRPDQALWSILTSKINPENFDRSRLLPMRFVKYLGYCKFPQKSAVYNYGTLRYLIDGGEGGGVDVY